MKRWAWGLAALVLLAFLAGRARWPGQGEGLLRVADGVLLHLGEALPDLLGARVVFVGELHDQPSHHAAQLRVLRAFHEADRPVALALEMFRADGQPVLDRWTRGTLSLEEFLPAYYDNWNFPWVYYRGLFLYAREHGIPLVGLNVPEATIRQVARRGFGSLSAAQLEGLPAVRCEVDAAYEEFVRRALGLHGRGGPDFVSFCEAQLLWDSAMAANLVAFLETNQDHAVVVVAGSGHAWKRGIAEQVGRLGAYETRVVLPEHPGRLDRTGVTPEDADYLWLGLALE